MSMEKRSFISEDWTSLWLGLFVFGQTPGLFLEFFALIRGVKTNSFKHIHIQSITLLVFYKAKIVCNYFFTPLAFFPGDNILKLFPA